MKESQRNRRRCTVPWVTLLVFASPAHAKEVAENYARDSQLVDKLCDRVVDRFIDRALEVPHFHHADLDKALLGKSGQLRVPSSNLVTPDTLPVFCLAPQNALEHGFRPVHVMTSSPPQGGAMRGKAVVGRAQAGAEGVPGPGIAPPANLDRFGDVLPLPSGPGLSDIEYLTRMALEGKALPCMRTPIGFNESYRPELAGMDGTQPPPRNENPPLWFPVERAVVWRPVGQHSGVGPGPWLGITPANTSKYAFSSAIQADAFDARTDGKSLVFWRQRYTLTTRNLKKEEDQESDDEGEIPPWRFMLPKEREVQEEKQKLSKSVMERRFKEQNQPTYFKYNVQRRVSKVKAAQKEQTKMVWIEVQEMKFSDRPSNDHPIDYDEQFASTGFSHSRNHVYQDLAEAFQTRPRDDPDVIRRPLR